MRIRILTVTAVAGSLALSTPATAKHDPVKCKAAKVALKAAKKTKNRTKITRAEFNVMRYCDF